MRTAIVYLIGLALLPSLVVQAAPLDLAAVCGSDRVELKTVAQLEALKQQADSAGAGKCPQRVIEAITDLAAIVKDKQACRMDKAEAITRFVDKYLKQSAGEIPKAVADFAVAYGMQVSRICSEEMVDGFASNADARIHNKLGPDEYNEFLRFKNHLIGESPVKLILTPILKTGELILPNDLLGVMPELGIIEKLELELPRSGQLIKFKNYCENLLQPLYESTLLPLAHLNRAGFISKIKYRRGQYKENGRFWSSVIFLCESLRMVTTKPIESAEQANDVCNLRDMTMSLADHMKLEDQSSSEQLIADAPMEKYESEQQVEGEILSRSVKALVKKFDANKSETERLRERLQSRSFRIIKALLKRAKYRPTIKKMIKAIKVKDGANDEKVESIRAALDKLAGSGELDWSMSQMMRTTDHKVSEHEQKGIALLAGLLLGLGILLVITLVIAISITCGGRGGGTGYSSGYSSGYGGGYNGGHTTNVNVYNFGNGGGSSCLDGCLNW